MTSCSSLTERKTRLIKQNEKQIASKLRLVTARDQLDGSVKAEGLYKETTKNWFKRPPIAQKIYIYDINRDSYLDLVFLQEKYSSPAIYFYNEQKKIFSRQTNFLFDKGHRSSFLIFDDFNKDGLTDVYDGQFYLNVEYNVPPSGVIFGANDKLGLKFKKGRLLLDKRLPHSSGTVFDLNRDGQVDFLQTFWMDQSNGRNKFFPPEIRNLKGEGVQIFPGDDRILEKGAPTWGADLCDLNNDHLIDLIMANTSGHQNFVLKGKELSGTYFFESGHKLFSHLIKDKFGGGQILGNGNSFGHLCVDFNNDGLTDVLSFEEKRQLQDQSRDPIKIHFQHPPTEKNYPFESIDFPIGRQNYSIKRAIDFDMDNDGDLDIILADSGYPPRSKLMLFENINGTFKDITSLSGLDVINPAGVNVFDIDNDGFLDIITGQSKIRSSDLPGLVSIFSLRNRNKNHSIFLRLQGQKSGFSAQGAVIKISSGNMTMKVVANYSRGGASGQRPSILHFGLGSEREFEVEVKWPHKDIVKRTYKGVLPPGASFERYNLCEDGRILTGERSCLN